MLKLPTCKRIVEIMNGSVVNSLINVSPEITERTLKKQRCL
jgi:hypothetical protein